MQTEKTFPIELSKAMACLKDENRQKIVLALKQKPFSYTELKKYLVFTNGNFNHHLLELIKASLITKYFEKSGKPHDSFYSISEFGRDFIDGVYNSLSPSDPIQELAPTNDMRMSWDPVLTSYKEEYSQKILGGTNFVAQIIMGSNKNTQFLLNRKRS